MATPILRFVRPIGLEPVYGEASVDSRLLFMGDRYRQLIRSYPEAVFQLTRRRSPDAMQAALEQSPELRQYYEVERHGDVVGLVMRDEIFRTQAPLDELEFEVNVTSQGHAHRYPLPLDRFAALGTLAPLLSGDRSEAQVHDLLSRQLSDDALTWARGLLEKLIADGFVERVDAPAPNHFLEAGDRPRVTFMAHTSLLVQSARTAVLFDPLFREPFNLRPGTLDVTRLSLGAICLSHSHWDHCDTATLVLFDKRTPILIPRVQKPTIFNPPIIPMLRLLGFEDIREVDHWQPVRIDDIEIIPVPFHGEQDEPEAEIDHYTYVVRTGTLSFYGGVDAFRDTFGDMFQDFERIRRDYQPGWAFLPVSQMTYEYRHGGVNGFCRKVDTSLVTQSFQYTADPALATEWLRRLGAKYAVPYATFTFDRMTPAGQAPDFADALERVGLGGSLVALRPLDTLGSAELSGGAALGKRQKFLRRWLRGTATMSRTDRKLSGNLAYRGVKKLVQKIRPKTEAAHHH